MASGKIIKTFDLEKEAWTTEYTGRKDLLSIVLDPDLRFGVWTGYAYVGDYNENGLDELLIFRLTGMSFLPTVYEFDGQSFRRVLEFETPNNSISGVKTGVQDNRKLVKIWGYGDEANPKPMDDWKYYAWDPANKQYSIVEYGP